MTAPNPPGPPSWPAETFDRLYATDPDPWRFATSPYEARKYADTLALLPERQHFAAALELGCSIGVFTARLAPRCDALLAVDVAQAALDRARAACAAHPHVRFARRILPADFPDGAYDLIVAAELLYFLSEDDLAALAARTRASLSPGGLVLLANWTGPTDTPSTGDRAAERFIAALHPDLRRLRHASAETFRLDLLG